MQNLFNGGHFHKFLHERESKLQREYRIQEIDLRIIKNMRKGMTVDMLKSYVDFGVYDNDELTRSLKRMYQQELIEIIKDEDGIHFQGFRLTEVGEHLWDKMQEDYNYATEVMFRGMTDEQIGTFKRLVSIIIYNIDKEVEEKKSKNKGGIENE